MEIIEKNTIKGEESYYRERYIVPPRELVLRASDTWIWIKRHLGTKIPQHHQKEIDLILDLAKGSGIENESKRSLADKYSFTRYNKANSAMNWQSEVRVESYVDPSTSLLMRGGPKSSERDEGFNFEMYYLGPKSIFSKVDIRVSSLFEGSGGLRVHLDITDGENSGKPNIFEEIIAEFRGDSLVGCPGFLKK